MNAHKLPQPEALIAIAERCEAATGPDGELDEAIEKSLPCSRKFAENNPHAPPTQWNERGAQFHGARIGDYDGYEEYHSPRYTASLDAAMMLVPEGWRISRWCKLGHGGVEAELKLRSAIQYEKGEAGSFALALCAAALRARAAQ